MVIYNGVVHPMDGPVIERGYVAFEGEKITAVGPMEALPAFPLAEGLDAEELLLFRSRLAQVLQEQKKYIRLGRRPEDIAEAMCKLALSTRAKLTILPVQDVLGLGNDARMNHPSTREGNWQFRMERRFAGGAVRRLKHWIKLYRR